MVVAGQDPAVSVAIRVLDDGAWVSVDDERRVSVSELWRLGGDVCACTDDLADFGWEAPTASLPAAYLTGALAGRRAIAADVEAAVLDIGLNSPTPGSKVFAVQEGAIDAGVEVPHNDDVLADWERTRGEHIAEYAESLDEGLYSGDFDATDLPAHFDEVREAILEADL